MINLKKQIVFAAVLTCFAPLSWADSNFRVKHSWVRMVPPVSANTAGYFRLCNDGDVADKLTSVSSSAAKVVEFHTVEEKEGASTMKQLASVPVAAGSCTVFQPGGKHLMFIGLVEPLKENATVPVTLGFKNGGMLKAEFVVKKQGEGHDHHKHHKHGEHH